MTMPQIAKIVVLMLENRSLDNVLGWLHEDVELPADQVFPPGSRRRFNGIRANMHNDVDGYRYAPSHGTHQLPQPLRQPRWNPNEWFENVFRQAYLDGGGNSHTLGWDDPPPMTGFAYDYSKWYDATGEVMGAYTRDQLPVLYGLAENYAVSDRWFSSIPTETNPNRAFFTCGTSLGALDNSDAKVYGTRTVFDALTEAGKRWGVYYQYNGRFDMDPTRDGGCYTVDIFPRIREAIERDQGRGNCRVGPLADFLADLNSSNADDLSDVSFIEPFWGGGYGLPGGDDFIGLQGNDYHAPAWLGPAEYDLLQLYTEIRNSPHWPNMLLFITFDEHGGTWDHEPMTRTIAPDDSPTRLSFDFTRLGVRVPTILVSPFVRPGTVFRAPSGSPYDFDHTSFIATILRWAGVDPAAAGLGARVAVAPTFEDVLSQTPFANSPVIKVPQSYRDQGGRKGRHNIPFAVDNLPVQVFRAACDEATSAEDFLERLRVAAQLR